MLKSSCKVCERANVARIDRALLERSVSEVAGIYNLNRVTLTRHAKLHVPGFVGRHSATSSGPPILPRFVENGTCLQRAETMAQFMGELHARAVAVKRPAKIVAAISVQMGAWNTRVARLQGLELRESQIVKSPAFHDMTDKIFAILKRCPNAVDVLRELETTFGRMAGETA